MLLVHYININWFFILILKDIAWVEQIVCSSFHYQSEYRSSNSTILILMLLIVMKKYIV